MTSILKRFLGKNKEETYQNIHNAKIYDEAFAIPKKLLRWTTIRMSQNIGIAGIYWDSFYWFEFAMILAAVGCEIVGISLLAMAAKSIQDMSKVFRMVPCIGSAILSIFKSFKIVYNRPVYENLVNELRNMWPKSAVSGDDRAIIETALKQLNLIVKGYFWCNNVLLISFLSPPFFITLGRYCGYDAPMNLHFIFWLPFDPLQPVYYEFMLVLQTWLALIAIWWNVAWDMLFCTFICLLTIQFDLLALRIKRLISVQIDRQLIATYPLGTERFENKPASRNTYSSLELETKHIKEIINMIMRHHSLIRLSKDVEKMCSLTLLVNFLNGSIMICFCGFCCIVLEKWNDVTYKSFLVTTLSQTWLICWYGQKLIDSSLSIGKAVYNCGWYDASQGVKNSLLIMLHRAQRSVHVTTYGFSVVSLESFSKIVKSSWTYFTLLMNFYKD